MERLSHKNTSQLHVNAPILSKERKLVISNPLRAYHIQTSIEKVFQSVSTFIYFESVEFL